MFFKRVPGYFKINRPIPGLGPTPRHWPPPPAPAKKIAGDGGKEILSFCMTFFQKIALGEKMKKIFRRYLRACFYLVDHDQILLEKSHWKITFVHQGTTTPVVGADTDTDTSYEYRHRLPTPTPNFFRVPIPTPTPEILVPTPTPAMIWVPNRHRQPTPKFFFTYFTNFALTFCASRKK